MFDEIKTLYTQLESTDLNLLLHVQNKSFKELSRSLKAREKHLQAIGELLEYMRQDNAPESERSILIDLQKNAMSRNQRIVSLMSDYCRTAREELLKCPPGTSRISPYMRKTPQRRRVKA